ncbi:uncharacterized protein BDFB_006101, partial [Asbolus verrucosus]
MTDKTPKRPTNSSNTVPESPAAASPQKNLTGLPRVVRDLVADVYNNIQKWNDLHIKGANIVKQVASLKSNNPKDFSLDLEEFMNELYTTVQALRHYKDALLSFTSQMKALPKLQKESEQLFISLSARSMSNLVEEISKAYEAEFGVKELVLENIAHSKNKDEAMFLAALWTYQHKIPDKNNQISKKNPINLFQKQSECSHVSCY